ncbi:MAG: hypothetical protein QY305_05070 [Candidatus Brocadiaceae baterium WH-1]|nr:MAG: hypothetical protein QY305_05070 [Candidatus Jettenia sp. AMX2]
MQSKWVDQEIKHILRRENLKKGNGFGLNKVISIYDSQDTYNAINEQYPKLTDKLFHFMPRDYDKIQLGRLISAIWSKYFSLNELFVKNKKPLGVDTSTFGLTPTVNPTSETDPSHLRESLSKYLEGYNALSELWWEQEKYVQNSSGKLLDWQAFVQEIGERCLLIAPSTSVAAPSGQGESNAMYACFPDSIIKDIDNFNREILFKFKVLLHLMVSIYQDMLSLEESRKLKLMND